MNFSIRNLGDCKYKSPLIQKVSCDRFSFITDRQRMLYNVMVDPSKSVKEYLYDTLEIAGPREMVYFEPEKVRCAIATCGGLCPGLNDVIRSIVMESHYRYGVRSIIGIRYGYNGLNPVMGYEPLILSPDTVEDIHKTGGTILGSSRGGTEDMELLFDTLVKWKINILYTIGGDGTLKGSHEFANIAKRRGVDLAVVGIPKTIDNDISYIQRSFGFETAFSEAVKAIQSAHVESKGAPNGIGLVKLMGRHSGFIAANATLAMNDVNFVLVPELPLDLDGENGFLAHLEERIKRRGHAVICVAEGAGQDLMNADPQAQARDASGNIKLEDIGLYLKSKINEYFKHRNIEINLKYIDPSYTIRSAPAVPNDSIFCALLGQYAVHAGMAGKTDLIIGLWNNIYTHIPIEMAISTRKQIDINSQFWFNVIEATGQPMNMKNRD